MSSPKNVLCIMTDQHRPDYLGFHPRGRLATPNIDRLAEGTAFLNCVTANPICTPARTALLTGKYTHQIGTLAMSGDLSLQHPTYFRALRDAGYYTMGIGKFHWMQGWPWHSPRGGGHDLVALKDRVADYGLDLVWEVSGKQLALRNYCEYAKVLDERGLLDAYRDHIDSRGPNVMDATQEEFTGQPWPFDEELYVDNVAGAQMVRAIHERPGDRPFCLFASFCSPHPPYDPPASYLARVPVDETDDFIETGPPMPDAVKARLCRTRRAYRAMLLLVDDWVGRLCDALEEEGILDDTVILFTSDHGEMLGDRGMVQKMSPWWPSAHVPCIIRHPDYLHAGRYTAPVELTDLTATMLDVAGLDARDALSKPWPAFHDRVPCRSLLPVLRGETDRVRDYAFSECAGWWQMIVSEQWKFIHYQDAESPEAPHEELFDRQADPAELDNRIADPACAEAAQWCRQRLQYTLDRTPPAQTGWAPYEV